MPIRRYADPKNVQLVWDAIRSSNAQRIPADIPKLAKHMERICNYSPAQAELYIKQVEDDGLIIASKSVSKTTQGEVYSIPIEKEVPPDDGYDWYCIECHLAGEVLACKDCYRVFHKECSFQAGQRDARDQIPHRPAETVTTPIQGNSSSSITSASTNASVSANASDVEPQQGTSDVPVPVTHPPALNVIQIPDEEDPQQMRRASTSSSSQEPMTYDVALCCMCNLARTSNDCDLAKDELNHLLGYILQRIKSWVPDRLTNKMSIEVKPDWCTESELSWRSGQLFYQHMDMSVIELKLRTRDYSRMCEFQADVVTIQHNIAVFHGMDSQEYGAAELMHRDCYHDISEMQNCVDCYKHSNEKVNNKWFCFPCRKQHRLVWAKQKGYPYWPAKVLRESELTCDVRFFGGKYERSILSKLFIKPIDTVLTPVQIKKTLPFNKAVEELKLHRLLLENPDDVENIMLLNSKPVKGLPSVRRLSVPLKRKSMETSTPERKVGRPRSSGSKITPTKPIEDFDVNDGYVPNNTNFEEKFNKKVAQDIIPQTSSASSTRSSSAAKSVPEVLENVDIIDISDGDEFHPEPKLNGMENKYETSEPVSSSTEYLRPNDDTFGLSKEVVDGKMQPLDQQYCDAVEKMRRKLEACKDRDQMIKVAVDCMQQNNDDIINQHNDSLKALFESHNQQILDTKKKQWCFNCGQDAIYHCCWNTSYCSPSCQQNHWQSEHKKVCRRKR